MRWFVNINGRTTGPLEEQDLTQMVREGLVAPNAYIRDETGGAWLELAKSPFGRFLSKSDPRTSLKVDIPRSKGRSAQPAPSASSKPVAKRASALDELFDHELSMEGLSQSIPPKGAEPLDMGGPSSIAPASIAPAGSLPPALGGDDLFDRALRLDEERLSTELPRIEPRKAEPSKSAKPQVLKPMSKDLFSGALPESEPPPAEEPSALFKTNDMDDFDNAFDALSMRPAAPQRSAPGPVLTMSPSITIDGETTLDSEPPKKDEPDTNVRAKAHKHDAERERAASTKPAVKAATSQPAAKKASQPRFPSSSAKQPDGASAGLDFDLDAEIAAIAAQPAPNAKEEAATEPTAEPAPPKPGLREWWQKGGRRLKIRVAISVASLALVAVAGSVVNSKLAERRERAAQAALEAKQRAEREAKIAEEAKQREERLGKLAIDARVKCEVWAPEIAAAKAETDPNQSMQSLQRLQDIRKEAESLANELGARAPVELTKILATLIPLSTELTNRKKAQEAVTSSMGWLREIHLASVTTVLDKIPNELERVNKIQKLAAALATELGPQAPVELTSVMPAATTAVALLENAQKVLEAFTVAEKEVARGEKLAEARDWIAADKAYQDALAALEKVPAVDRGGEPVPAELNLANAKSRVTSLRNRIASAVTQELRRLELERKQREQEAEIERKANEYRARCGGPPTVSPFDGQLFGLAESIRKASREDTGPFKITKCSDPVMTKTDCWVST
ncbi:MAG TPA: GYF domain-containing protein, partial [Polyangiaceae bacterium]|nr:GYF domain-containing protein [Polyangiaceae bacterium]